MKTNIRSAYAKMNRVTLKCDPSQSRTEQHHKLSCDINQIVNRFERTGIIEHENKHAARYDYCTGQTFEDAMNIIAEGQSMFEDLPASLRKRFNHDPAQFLDFVQNPKNGDEMIELGLAHKPRKADNVPGDEPPAPKPAKPAPEPKKTPSGDEGVS